MWIANSIIRNDNLKDRREALKYFAQMAAVCSPFSSFLVPPSTTKVDFFPLFSIVTNSSISTE